MDILKQLESYNGLKLKDIVFNKSIRKLSANFLYNPNLFVVADKVAEIESLLKSIVPQDVVVETKFNRTNLDKANIALFIVNAVTNNFPSLAKNFSLDDIKLTMGENEVLVDLFIDPMVHDFVANNGREKDIEDKLHNNFFADFKVVLNKKADYVSVGGTDAIADSKEFNESIKFFDNKVLYKIFNVNHIVNKVEYNSLHE
jgi:hypothetical protein